MRVPVYFKQCQSVREAEDFILQFCKTNSVSKSDMVLWRTCRLVGLVGDIIRICPSHGFDTKVCFYDTEEKDYEMGVWSDRIRLFKENKREVLRMTIDEVAQRYFRRRGIPDYKSELSRRAPGTAWDAPAFFAEHGIESFECMYDCEQYMRKVLLSDRIFDVLKADDVIFHKASREVIV